jgi:predicted nucleic acid-binding protein
LTETHSTQAADLWEHWDNQGTQVAVPILFKYELVAAIRKHVHRGTISTADGLTIRDELLAKSVHLMFDETLLRRGYELATQFNRPTAYDAQYLAVAERLGCEFWTGDEKLFNTVKSALPWVKWVGNFTPPSVNQDFAADSPTRITYVHWPINTEQTTDYLRDGAHRLGESRSRFRRRGRGGDGALAAPVRARRWGSRCRRRTPLPDART